MNNKIIVALMSLLPTMGFAHENIPQIKKGLTIVELTQAQDEYDKQFVEQLVKEENTYGYQLNNANNADFLLTLANKARKEITENKNNEFGDYDTHLKNHYSEIKLTFKFNGLKAINPSYILGYAAIGQYMKDDKNDGWNGIRVFFNEPMLGMTCAYAFNEFYGATLYKEFVKYSVNGKATHTTIEGNDINGFVYIVEWFNQNSMSTLECANKLFDKDIMNKMIVLANKIDRN